MVRPALVLRHGLDLRLVYPWRNGRVLHQATVRGSDRSGLSDFRSLPLRDVQAAVDSVINAHVEVAARGYVSVDLYDGCVLYDFDERRAWLIDLDEYRPGPFVLGADRLPGSRRYMAPEELARGSTIDERTMVFTLGRMIHELCDSMNGWRGTPEQRSVVKVATAVRSIDRYTSVAALAAAWARSTRSGNSA